MLLRADEALRMARYKSFADKQTMKSLFARLLPEMPGKGCRAVRQDGQALRQPASAGTVGASDPSSVPGLERARIDEKPAK